jgi:hypothetical protein
MNFFKPHRKKPSELFGRAVAFTLMFFIVMIFFIMSSKHEKTGDPQFQIMKGMAKYTEFDDKKKDELKARNGGFWQFASDTNTDNSLFYMTDRFELKTNGIFWQVTEYTIGLPSKKTARFLKITHGYLNPFAKEGKSLDTLICDVHIINQAYIMGADTCYGQSNTDTTLAVVADGKRFELEGRIYAPYDTAGPALYAFFPKEALNVVDKLSIPQCPKSIEFQTFAKNAVAADMAEVTVDTLSPDAVQKIIDAYYRYFLDNRIKTSTSWGERAEAKGNLKVSFDITWDGKVKDVKIVALSKQYEKIRQVLMKDIGAWTFPRKRSAAPVFSIEREFWF